MYLYICVMSQIYAKIKICFYFWQQYKYEVPSSEKKIFFHQKFLDSIKISYEKFCFDTTSLTHQNADFPPPPSKAAPPGGPRKKKFFSPKLPG